MLLSGQASKGRGPAPRHRGELRSPRSGRSPARRIQKVALLGCHRPNLAVAERSACGSCPKDPQLLLDGAMEDVGLFQRHVVTGALDDHLPRPGPPDTARRCGWCRGSVLGTRHDKQLTAPGPRELGVIAPAVERPHTSDQVRHVLLQRELPGGRHDLRIGLGAEQWRPVPVPGSCDAVVSQEPDRLVTRSWIATDTCFRALGGRHHVPGRGRRGRPRGRTSRRPSCRRSAAHRHHTSPGRRRPSRGPNHRARTASERRHRERAASWHPTSARPEAAREATPAASPDRTHATPRPRDPAPRTMIESSAATPRSVVVGVTVVRWLP